MNGKKVLAIAALLFILLMAACGSNDSDDDGLPADGDGDGDGDVAEDGDASESSEEADGDLEQEAEEVIERKLIDYVNPFVGTGGQGFGVGSATPAATAPFGMVKVGPDSAGETGTTPGYSHCAGYAYDDVYIRGFSHIHMHGIGVPDYGNIMFMPLVGMDQESSKEKNYRSTYAKESEAASPGYYTVRLDSDVNVELAASEHTAYHRYAYPEGTGDDAYVLIDLSHGSVKDFVKDAEIFVDAKAREIKGWVHHEGNLTGRFGGLKIYFVARFEEDFGEWGTWKDWQLFPAEETQQGKDCGAYVQFASTPEEPVEFQVGVSYVDLEQAALNLEEEWAEFDMESLLSETEAMWEEELSLINARGADQRTLEIFYSSMYHAFQMPTLFTDVNGKYRGFDKEVHDAEGFTYYTDFSMWDTYRTLHPLLIMIQPERQLDMVKSLIKMYEQGGGFPKWPSGIGYTGCMVGTSADIVVSESYIKGLTDFDAEKAYTGLYATATAPPPDGVDYAGRGSAVLDYVALGYVADDKHGDSVSQSQEYYCDDWALHNFAKALGKDADAEVFKQRALSYPTLWHPESKFFRGKNEDGSWVEGFNDESWLDYYTEGTAWQYRFFVPHDAAGLAELFGGRQQMFDELEVFFQGEKDRQQRIAEGSVLDALGTPQYYWHGNEPDLHSAYIYSDVGHPSKTQEWVRWIMDALYDSAPDGIQGNDDCGTLAAWYVFSAMGFYPIAGTTKYLIGSPIFEEATIKIGDKELKVIAHDAGAENVYVQWVKLNDVELTEAKIEHEQIAAGGTLEFQMGPQPSEWGEI